jgi:hypothetical protein
MNILLRILKIETVLLNERLLFSQFLTVFLWRKSKTKFLLPLMKSLTNCENPSRNPLQRACSDFLIAACVSKSCSRSRLWFWKWDLRKTGTVVLMWLSEQFLELVNVFKEARKNLIFMMDNTAFKLKKWINPFKQMYFSQPMQCSSYDLISLNRCTFPGLGR